MSEGDGEGKKRIWKRAALGIRAIAKSLGRVRRMPIFSTHRRYDFLHTWMAYVLSFLFINSAGLQGYFEY